MYITNSANPMTSAAFESGTTALQHHRSTVKTWTYDTIARDLRVVPSVYTASSNFAASYSAPLFGASDNNNASIRSATRSSSPTTEYASAGTAQQFQCPQLDCGRQFNRRYSLAEHVKTHSGEKSHVCPAMGCRKRFSTSGNLSRHKRLHGYIEPLQCPVEGCRSKFSSNNKLDKHMKYHYGSPVHVCKIGTCGKTFSTMGNLNRHIKHHHQQGDQFESDSGRSSFTSTASSSTRLRSSSAPPHHYHPLQSPTATDDLYSSTRERALSRERQYADSSSSAASAIPFPRIHPANVNSFGDPERVWSHDTILDSLAAIFDEDAPVQPSGAQPLAPSQGQQHYHPNQHQHYHLDTRQNDDDPASKPEASPAAVCPPNASLLDDIIHFHVANFQC